MTKSIQFFTTVLVLVLSTTILVPLTGATETPWTTIQQMPTARTGFGAALVDGTIYAVGGSYDSHGENEAYNIATNSWTTKKAMPTPRYQFGTAVVDNKIYIIGGAVEVALNQVYDTETNTWSTGTSMLTGVDSAAAGVLYDDNGNGRIYVIGGKQNLDAVNLTQIYDPTTDTWNLGTSMPTARYGLAVAVVDNALYAIGGRLLANGFPVTAVTEKYTPSTDAIPEFSSLMFLPVVAIVATIAFFYKKKLTKHQ